MKNANAKRSIAVILCALMLGSLFPVSVLAEDYDPVAALAELGEFDLPGDPDVGDGGDGETKGYAGALPLEARRSIRRIDRPRSGRRPDLNCRRQFNLHPAKGNNSLWKPCLSALRAGNEKYRGDALLQKTFTVDFLTKKHKVNEGEIPQYYVRGNHECCPKVNTNAPPQKARIFGIS